MIELKGNTQKLKFLVSFACDLPAEEETINFVRIFTFRRVVETVNGSFVVKPPGEEAAEVVLVLAISSVVAPICAPLLKICLCTDRSAWDEEDQA